MKTSNACIRVNLVSIVMILLLVGCRKQENAEVSNALFQLLPADSTGVDFVNRVSPDDTINILTYEYLYNGGGVGVGDFNNDGFQDVFFAGSQVPHKLYINKGQPTGQRAFSFEDVTEGSGITRDRNWAFGVSVVDINQDGWQDIYVSMGGPGNMNRFPNRLFVHQGLDPSGQPVFEEMAEEYRLADRGHSIQALFFDYDRDGDLDMYQLTGGGFERSPNNPSPIVADGTSVNTDRLYRNDYGEQEGHPVFTDVSKEAGILHEGYGLGVSLLDINEDGWPDVYVTNDYLTNDHLYLNNGNGTFSEKVAAYFKHTSHFAMGNDVGDINNDGFMEVMAVDMLPEDHARRKLMFGATQYNKFYYAVNHGYTYQYMRNTLQLNNGNGSFSEIGQLAGVYQTDWSWSVLFADLDNDAYQDIFITNGFGKDITDLDFVKFRSSMTGDVKNETRRRKILLDSLAARPGIRLSNYAYRNNGNLRFSKVTAPWGFDVPAYSNGAAYADFDNDGDLDLAVSNIDEGAHLYRNNQRERNSTGSNYLRIRLKGSVNNQSGIGSTVTLRYDGKLQRRVMSVVRGFQSSVDENIHFGLDTVETIDTIQVQWPDGKAGILTNVKTNQTLVVNENMTASAALRKARPSTTFEVCGPEVASYQHIENHFIDFNHEPLIPNKLSQEGPGIAVGDVNGDGLDDFFVGGALLRSGKIFVQKRNGTFDSRGFKSPDLESEDMGCLFFDADNDGDEDLYVVSGGNEYNPDHRHYQDRLYRNDGSGNFSKDPGALPKIGASGSCVVAADFDRDGYLDLFVGGRVLPTGYPKSPRSYLLKNDGTGSFKDVTKELSEDLSSPGMVTSALWTDFDNDNWMDLVIAGEYMPITFFRNEAGKRLVKTSNRGLADSEGWWKSLTPGDFDNDGDMDYIAGNFGLNSHYRASADEPINVHFKDFDNNGALEAITSYYEKGKNYPTASLDLLTSQLPVLKRKILFHRTYANTSTEGLMKIAGAGDTGVRYCKTLESALIENVGGGEFAMRQLPLILQTAPVYGVLAEDVDGDGNLDIIAVGNSYAPDVVTGRCDAFIGQVMLGDGNGNFAAMDVNRSGFFVSGDAKAIVELTAGGEILTLVAQNNDSLRIFKRKLPGKVTRLKLNKTEVSAVITMKNGKTRRMENTYGTGYLSQSHRSIFVTSGMKKIILLDFQGRTSRTFTY